MDVRPYAEQDRAELRALFEHAGDGSPSASLWGHPDAEAAVYLDPYLDVEPASVFVAAADGRLVGYLVGAVDTARFPGESKRIEAAIRTYRLPFRAASAPFFGRALADAVTAAVRRRPTAGEFHDPRWPSHLHIAVSRPARGTGAAGALMTSWIERLRAAGSPGCHLQTLVENEPAVRFFTRMGFTPQGDATAVPGLRYHGARVHQLTMVRAV